MPAARQLAHTSQPAILDALPTPLLTVGADWQLGFLNAAALRFLGGAASDWLGRDLWEACPELQGTALEDQLRQTLRAGEGATFEGSWPRRAGRLNLQTFALEGGLGLQFSEPDGRPAALDGPPGASAALEARLTLHARELEARNRALQAETEALTAFVNFSEAAAESSDTRTLALRAVEVLRRALGEVTAVYYEPVGSLWLPRVWSADLDTPLLEGLSAGVPQAQPSFARAFEERAPIFVDGWDAVGEGLTASGAYHRGALYPFFAGFGSLTPRGLLTMGGTEAARWSERERAVFRTVGRSLALALDRVAALQALRASQAEVLSRNAALEGFALLARDLAFETDAAALVRRAQEIVLPLLPAGYAVYYEPDGERWRLRAQTGSLGSSELQGLVDAGLPFEDTGNLLTPWRQQQPYYQDSYDPQTDHLADLTRHVGATAALPILVDGQPRGVFALGLFGKHHWTEAEKALLETTASSLRLALERAQSAAERADQQLQLQEANAELEAFAYSASHDLRTPVRHIQGFTDLLRRELGEEVPEKAGRLLNVIESASLRMSTLIDELLAFSRLGRQALRVERVDLNVLLREVLSELESETAGRVVHWTLGPLPVVQGDAGLLHQVLENLLANALKYSSTRPEAEIEVRARSAPGEDIVEVRDNGVGFDPRYAARLFGVFQRLHRESEFAGTGVGLANVRRIVQKHGGRVWAESTLGEGARFSFSLPRP